MYDSDLDREEFVFIVLCYSPVLSFFFFLYVCSIVIISINLFFLSSILDIKFHLIVLVSHEFLSLLNLFFPYSLSNFITCLFSLSHFFSPQTLLLISRYSSYLYSYLFFSHLFSPITLLISYCFSYLHSYLFFLTNFLL